MALMIPETLNEKTVAVEQKLFLQLRRTLPSTSVVWHRDALELEPDQALPFIVLDNEIGIGVVVPLDWPQLTPMDVLQLQQGTADGQIAQYHHALVAAENHTKNLVDLMIESGLPGLVTDTGILRPQIHLTFVLHGYSSSTLNRSGLRGLSNNALILAEDEIDQLHSIVRQQTPLHKRLDGETFSMVRMVIAPSVEIVPPSQNGNNLGKGEAIYASTVPLMLDPYQEQIVKSYTHIPEDQETLARELDTRLLRGVAGSGKSLILLHRAKYLSQLNPHWKILVLTYTRSLVNFLRSRMRDLPHGDAQVEVINFHAWSFQHLQKADMWRSSPMSDRDAEGLLANIAKQDNIVPADLEFSYIVEEFNWIRDNNITSWAVYATIIRRGRKRRLLEAQRSEIWKLLELFQKRLKKSNQFDWAEVPLAVRQGIESGKITAGQYDAILVDEAQDFAPSWFHVAQKMLNPKTNMLFIASDSAQKIYKQTLSWRSIGIDVTGNRSRILDRSYRNTYEILRVAHELVGDPGTQSDLIEEGDGVIRPELDQDRMRRGPDPMVLSFQDTKQEHEYILQEINDLREIGCAWRDIAVFHCEKTGVESVAAYLKRADIPVQILKGTQIDIDSPDVKLMTLHSSKGLEFTSVFVAGVNKLQPRSGLAADEIAEAIAFQRRLLYVGMTRARQRLYITYVGALPSWAGYIAI